MAPLFNSNDPEMSECGSFSFDILCQGTFRCLRCCQHAKVDFLLNKGRGAADAIDIEVER